MSDTWVQRTSPSTVVVRRGTKIVLALIDDGEVDRIAHELLATNPTTAPTEETTCTCEVLPERYWFRYGGAVEPGSQIEPNPECPVHFPRTAESKEN